MLPLKLKIGTLLVLAVFCANTQIAFAAQKNTSPTGIWQDGLINCYICDSVEECANGNNILRKCEKNDAQTCIIVFDASGAVAQRACSDSIDKQYNNYCSTNPTKCPSCTSSGCNDASAGDEYSTCLSCESSKDANCARAPTKISTTKLCHGGCMTAAYTTAAGGNYMVRSCLNDRDLDEREACLTGADNECIGCVGVNCNVQVLPQDDKHRCFQCSGENCDDPLVATCTIFDEQARCYTQFDKDVDVVSMGCASSLGSEAEIENLLKTKSVWLCEGDNCNDFINMPAPNECTICDSTEDEACAIRPNAVTKHKKCNIVPYTQCYERVNMAKGGITERGCLTELNGEEFLNCLKGDDANCKVCTGESCNSKIIPANRRQCQRCDSQSDVNCERSPASATFCPLYMPNDTCVAVYADGITKRACSSEFTCDDTKNNCQVCNSNGCNSYNMKRRNDEQHGLFQDLPINCYKCEGVDCADEFVGLGKCTGDEYQDCVTVFDKTGAVVRRGCEDHLEATYVTQCETNPELCLKCKSNGCNSVSNLDNVQECLYCDSANNPQCLLAPSSIQSKRNCAEGCLTALYYAKNGERHVARTCFEDIELDDRDSCIAQGNCVKCTDANNCNTAILPAAPEPLSCLHCDGADCNMPTSKKCEIAAEGDQCYIHFDEIDHSAIRMGCKSSLPKGTLPNQIRYYFLCDGDDCNDYSNLPEANLCFVCDSSEDVNCAINPAALKNREFCEIDPHTDCYTRIGAAGETIRGCSWDLPTEQFLECHLGDPDGLCEVCTESNCNKFIYPYERQTCYQCSSDNDPNCELAPDASGVCQPYNPDDTCVSVLIGGITKRGCSSELSCIGAEKCKTCEELDCNTDILTSEATSLSCLHCDGADCNMPKSKQCDIAADGDQCYIYFDEIELSAVRMGCKSSLPQGTLPDKIKYYFLCDGDDCNDFSNLPEANMCFVCDSAKDVNCAINPSAIKAQTHCQTNPHTDCYTRIGDAGQTIRGCVWALTTEQFLECHLGDPKGLCGICTESNCNRNIYPGSRQRCHQCNSEDDPNCEKAPDATGVCQLYNPDEICVSTLVGGITKRGCSSELSCDGAEKCKSCEKNNCNVHNLVDQEAIGPPGLFQGLPLNCYRCEGLADCAGEPSNVNKCEGTNKYQTCVTAFNADGKVIGRGCSDALSSTCSDSDSSCYECKSNGCNEATTVADYIDCVYCDAKENAACIFNLDEIASTRKCYKNCMTALYPRTDDVDAAYELIRTCADDMDLDDRELCAEGKHTNCKSCSDENCNTDDLGAERRKSCYHCSGEDCQDPQVEQCRAISDADQCFVQYDEAGTITEMGCKSKYDPSEVKLLVTAKRLWLCDADNCNTFDNLPKAQTCTLCSSVTDARCATAPNTVESSTTCGTFPYTQCYTRLLESGHTNRGCLSSVEGDDFYACLTNSNTTGCLSCAGANCNKEVFPVDRLSCYQCNSATTASCEAAPTSAGLCLKHTVSEQCVTALNEKGDTERGCSSQVICDPKDPNTCRVCDGNDCNIVNLKRKSDGKPGLWQPLPLTCLTCDNEAECADATREAVCADNAYCMTVFGQSGKVVKRGCSDAVEKELSAYCDANAGKCHNCNSNNCNRAVQLDDYIDCIYCDGDSTEDCITSVASVRSRRRCNKYCMTALRPKSAGSNIFELTRSCLDDKDVGDQQRCLSGSDELCKACEGTACNTATLPEDRWSCYSCEGDNCEDPQTNYCSNYKPNDQCFMLFDKNSDIKRMGCISDLDDSFVNNNIHLLFLCNDKSNCNSFENIPTPKVCGLCNSVSDENCAMEPSDVPAVATCSSLPHTKCYTRVQTNGNTDRGCLSSLSKNDIKDCLSGNSTTCLSCLGDRCNYEIFPADRRRCHRCNTKEDPKCESSPQTPAVCPFYSANEGCATKFVYGHTYRGCSSDFQCDESDKQYCRMCSGADNCNTVDLAITNIGYPGKWQSPPISCHTCKGTACNSALGQSQKCVDNEQQNCGIVFDASGTILQRACSDVIYASEYAAYCDKNPGFCKFCKSNDCNTATSLSDFVECVHCDGAENADCVDSLDNIKRTRSCNKKCFTALYPRNSDANPIYELSRGCMDDLEASDRQACENGNKQYCKACEGASCNKDIIPETRKKCYVCEGENCKNPRSRSCTSYRETDQCFALFDKESTLLRLGCTSDLNTAFIAENKRQLYLCDDDECNISEKLPTGTGCRVCNSLEDPECATKPIGGTAAACTDLPYTSCYTHVDNAGVTYRGCLSDVSDELFDECTSSGSKTCTICDSNNCNSEIYPVGRRSCNRCNSKDKIACESNPAQFASICPIYQEADQCVTKVESNFIHRGCSSDFTCDPSDRDTCRICNNDNCNNINLLEGYVGVPGKWQALPLSCYVCEDSACANSVVPERKCENNNLQTCMTVFDADGKVTRRGCSDAVKETHNDYCEENADKCFACKSNVCNNADNMETYIDCYACDSAENSECSVGFDGTDVRTRKCQKSCMVALYPRSSANNSAYELSRSCLDDMDIEDQEACVAGERKYCVACEGERCNAMALPAVRHSCYKCTDGNCEDFVAQECSAHQEEDKCYILFDEESSVAAMGCRSEFEMDVIEELTKQKRILLCEGKDCNGPEIIPTSKMCSVCNSQTDPRCATNPNLIANSERCSMVPYTECYMRVGEDGHTSRGCLSALPNETFYNCLTGNDNLCKICTGDNCNEIDIFPSDRMKCHQCDSVSDPPCSTAPMSNKVCHMYDEKDTCVTNLRNGVTTRGCSSSMKCDNEGDKRTCRTCNTPGCNTVNLEKVGEDGEPGRWQAVPITCYTCSSVDDCKDGGIFRVCTSNPYQNCMTIFNADGVVSQRGCSDAVEEANEAYCGDNADRCLRCNSNGCNSPTSLDDYVDCLHCDTDKNGDCVNNVASITKTRKCFKHCITALYPKYDEENPAYGLARTCYDDMDMDERDACEAGTLENCRVCSDAQCNTQPMPEKRLRCNMCSGDDCQEPKAAQCATYRADDKCYVRFDEQHSIVAMGCRSEFSNADADYLLQQKHLFYCDNDECNTIEALPVAQTCSLCSSRTDVNCATDPESVDSRTNCRILPYTECYTRVLSTGVTERGCLSSLYDDEFVSCWDGSSDTCTSCKGDNCNNKVYPTDRTTCHICDSSVDPLCEAFPNRVSICPKYDAAETCVTVYRNDVTYRGCSSSLECDSNPKNCVKCSGNGCNTINLAKRQDDNFGKWQDLPLSCLTCSGAECNSIEATKTLKCENNNQQDCVTVFDASGKVVARGCSDAITAEHGSYCDENEEDCYNCKSNGCNTATSKSNFNDCIYCDTHKNQNCLWSPLSDAHSVRKCQGGCMTALYPTDGSNDPSYDLIRTCLNDKETADQLKCSNGHDSQCSACVDNKCNVDEVPEDRLSCYICEGDSCEDPVVQTCPLYKSKDKCFIWFDEQNSIQQMGCLSSFGNQNLEEIIGTKRIHVCEGESCNTLNGVPLPQKCAVCDSNSNFACATNAKEISDFNTCSQLPYTGCYTKIISSDGSTARGCLADLSSKDFVGCALGTDEQCAVCGEEGCNREIFPADRQQCYTCSSEDDPDCESLATHTNTQPCPYISNTETCKTSLSGNVTVRGCKSDVLCDNGDWRTCRECIGTGCNTIDLRNKVDDGYHGVWQQLPLKCHICAGEHCLHSLGPAYSCGRNIEQDCMTVFNEAGDVIRRGCSDDVEDYEDLHCRQHPELCFKCKSNECNVVWDIKDYVECAFCDSSKDPLCAINPQNAAFATRKCNKECLVAIKESDTIRSCLDDKDLNTQNVCRVNANGKDCATCETEKCNNFVYPNDRRRCHVCTGASCISSLTQYCVKYDENDFCFAKYENGKVDLMGCGSAQNKSDLESWEAQKKLYRCEGDDCNDLTKLPKSDVCLSCDSSKTLECAQNPLLVTNTEVCNAPYTQCVTTVNSAGHTLRGCLSSLSQQEQDTCVVAGTCSVCDGEKCNREIFPSNRRRCYICNSSANGNCVWRPTESETRVCAKYAANDKCVARNVDDFIERGCASDFTCDASDEKYCQICDSDGCNIADVSGAVTVVSSLLLTLMLAYVATTALGGVH